jgi:hypothetical protein
MAKTATHITGGAPKGTKTKCQSNFQMSPFNGKYNRDRYRYGNQNSLGEVSALKKVKQFPGIIENGLAVRFQFMIVQP